MFKRRDYHKRGKNPIILLFRLLLSLMIFLVLIGGVYYAYKQFSGLDPLKINPQQISENFVSKEKLMDFVVGLLSFDFKKSNSTDSKSVTIPKDEKAGSKEQTSQKPAKKAPVLFKFMIVSDSHNENNLLVKALNQETPELIVGLGDYTEVGTLKELTDAKSSFDSRGIRYFVTAGDHDLWDSRDKLHSPRVNFNKVFGNSYQAFEYKGAKFLLIDNSDNYDGIDKVQQDFIDKELGDVNPDNKLLFALMQEPLYHPSSDRIMGKVTPVLKGQAKSLLKKFKDAKVSEVFAGDIHYYTHYQEPETGLSMTTAGAVTSQRNAESPRYLSVTVYEDYSYEIVDTEIK